MILILILYGAVLASWFRLKYPHIALGALASSAPVLYFDNIIKPEDGYYAVVTKDFKVIIIIPRIWLTKLGLFN